MIEKTLGIDFGERRIGLATNIKKGNFEATPLTTIDTKNINPLKKIKKIIDNQKIKLIIVGYPYRTDEKISEKLIIIDQFIEKLKQFTIIPIKKQNEAFSSVEAKNQLNQKKMLSQKNKIDSMAATIILQRYLNKVALDY